MHECNQVLDSMLKTGRHCCVGSRKSRYHSAVRERARAAGREPEPLFLGGTGNVRENCYTDQSMHQSIQTLIDGVTVQNKLTGKAGNRSQ
jgi:hypothetical protein